MEEEKVSRKRPYKKFKKGESQKKVFSKSGQVYKPRLWRGTGFPSGLQVKLKYSDILTINNLGVVVDVHQWRGNSLYDPDFTSTGHQPLYFDQLAAIYNRYRVDGCKIKIVCSTESPIGIMGVLYPTDENNISVTSISSACERTGAQDMVIVPARPYTFTKYVSSPAITGLSKAQYQASDKYCPDVNANPDEPWFWNFMTQTVDGTTAANMRVTVCLTYYAWFSEPNIIAQS